MAELKPDTRVAIYGRVSTRDKGQEVENQLAQLREFAAKQGWTISCEYADRESGTNRDRIEFQEMFRDAAHRRFDLLLFWSLDRFTREGVLETLTHLNRLTGAGVGYRSFTEPYFDSCGIFKDAVISILATIAKQERIRLSERVQAGLARARSRGSGSAGRKRSWMPQELLICARRATHGEKSRRKQESGSKNHCACAWLG
jgi:DNA invertase Pin-like site-specific DNA recombinase